MEKKRPERKDKEKCMSLTGHLKELRNRLAICTVVLLAGMLVSLFFAPSLTEYLLDIGRVCGYTYVYISPQELMMQYFTSSLVVAACAAAPMVLYQVWAFVQPGLRRREKLLMLLCILFGLAFFCAGVFFAYRVMLPVMLYFLSQMSRASSAVSAISVKNYVDFLMTIFVIFGAVFELPMLCVLLTQTGVLRPDWLKKGRKPIIVGIFFAAAFITPPDIVSQIMVALPMVGLYELGILLSTICQKLRKRNEKKLTTGPTA